MSALTDLRILDLADESGAYCGKLLADMGADVIKIEPPGGDPARDIGPHLDGQPDGARSLFFWHYHTNKRSVVLDLDAPADRERFAVLAASADAVITTGGPRVLARRGLDAATLHARAPHLVIAAISPFGQSGVRADWQSCDTVAQALGGMVFVNGHPDEPPLRSLGLQAYHSASTYAAIGILLALRDRERTGHGQLVDVSLQECVAATLEHVSGFFHQNGQIEVRRGTLHWSRYFRVAKCRDGYALHCTLGDWTSLIEWVKADGKAQDLAGPEWEDFNHRRRNCVHLFDVLDEWAKDYTVDELVEGAQLRRLPYAKVLPLERVPDNPQLQARGFFVPLEQPELGRTVTYPGAPYAFSRTPWQLRRRAPLVGEHTAEVVAETRSPLLTKEGDRGRLATRTAAPPVVPPWQGGTEPNSESTASPRALEGIRVLDFTWVVAGPVATRILADHGADVIKIERRDSLDFGSRRGGLTGNLNRGKRSVVVNMGDPRGVALVRDLVRHCDLVIDNFSARVMANWGLTYPSLREIKSDIIAISMSGFGHTGPHKDYVSYGPTLQALSGYTYAMRHPGREPAGWGFSYSDMVGGCTAALAALIALRHRARTGEGQFIDLAQFEGVTAVVGPALLDVLVHGHAPAAAGNRSPERAAAPHGIYRCQDLPGAGPARDRWCAIAVFTDEQWNRFVQVIGDPPWARTAAFATLAARLEHHDDLDRRVEEWTRTQTAEAAMETLQAAGIAAGLVANAEDLCARDPHLQARGYWATVTTPEGERFRFDGVPARLSHSPGRVAGPGPLLGEHTAAALSELLSLDEAGIAELREAGVIA
jgi:crotonobetainyl-CoA:carnitine CoA-transferase CaiB-like acyl-CoA transferase